MGLFVNVNTFWRVERSPVYRSTVADPGFPGEALTPEEGAPTYCSAKCSQKTAWKWKNLDLGVPGAPGSASDPLL